MEPTSKSGGNHLANNKWFQLSTEAYRASHELRSLVNDHLLRAWQELVDDEAERLLKDLDNVVQSFISSGAVPEWSGIQDCLIDRLSDKFNEALLWSGVLAALAIEAEKNAEHEKSRQLLAQSALVLLNTMTPRTVEAKNLSLARKGGQARGKKWDVLKQELAKLIVTEIPDPKNPPHPLFPNKKAAAEFFVGPLETVAHELGVLNQVSSFPSTIQKWFTEDQELRALIQPRTLGQRRRTTR